MDKQLIVQVRPDGTVRAETVGMAGEECLDYITALEDLLDAETTESAFTADYHRVAAEQSVEGRQWETT
ncbi:DUF2997 domain-containing protein [Georgenia thermotolerans]|uniref:DUF2997 domain-containing protein n=1 Tax=Georgenia thermotolerans TaxID=527326 RepID=A0A7J5UU56_9MICO|nr:DUF2997 domain-containing protein [Georgenia thermotolerans]KAE8765806.1 DUF2997 domain-containing protein [Georgenia thermotolerans]